MEERVSRRHPIEEEKKEDVFKKAEEDLVKFVSKQIELMNDNLLFSGQSQPGFYELNQSLMNYESIILSLTSLYAMLRYETDVAKENYENFYAQKYVEVKREQIALGKSAEFTAQREIDLFVRNNYLNDLSKLKAEIIKSDTKRNTIERLIKGWESYLWVLNSLSKNSQAEAFASETGQKFPKEFGTESLES